MPGRAAHQEAAAAAGGPEPTAAGGSAGAAAQQERRGLAGAFPLVLKKLMENPPREARLGERGGAAGARGAPRSSTPTAPFPPRGSEGGTRRVTAGLAAGGAPAGEAARPGSLPPSAPSLPPPPWPAEPRAGSTGSLLASRGLSSPERVAACAGQRRTLREPRRDTLLSAPRLSAASPACRRVAGSSSEKVSSLA